MLTATALIFEVAADNVDGGYSASAVEYGIHTQADSPEGIRSNVNEAVDRYFDDTTPRPELIRLRFERDEVPLHKVTPQRRGVSS